MLEEWSRLRAGSWSRAEPAAAVAANIRMDHGMTKTRHEDAVKPVETDMVAIRHAVKVQSLDGFNLLVCKFIQHTAAVT